MSVRVPREGIRFECQGSGKCCTSRGGYGYVYLTLKDRRRLSAHLGLKTATFTRRFCDSHDGLFHLKQPERDCRFLEGARCSVYAARPEQCRTWPFWPENMGARAWNKAVVSFCPGVGKGRLYSEVEIREIIGRQGGQ